MKSKLHYMATEFAVQIHAEMVQSMKRAKREGTVSMSFDCFLQGIPGNPCADGAPRTPWQFREIARETIIQDKTLQRFVKGI